MTFSSPNPIRQSLEFLPIMPSTTRNAEVALKVHCRSVNDTHGAQLPENEEVVGSWNTELLLSSVSRAETVLLPFRTRDRVVERVLISGALRRSPNNLLDSVLNYGTEM